MNNNPTIIAPGLYLDEQRLIGRLEIEGDVSHFHNADNAVIEIFRAVNRSVREDREAILHEKNNGWLHEQREKVGGIIDPASSPFSPPTGYRRVLHFSVEFPTFDSNRGVTSFKFNPSNTMDADLALFRRYVEEDLELLKSPFNQLLEEFLENEWSGFAPLLDDVYSAGSVDDFDYAAKRSNTYIKEFLVKNKYAPCSHVSGNPSEINCLLASIIATTPTKHRQKSP